MPPTYNAVKTPCNAFLLNIILVSSGEVKVEISLSQIESNCCNKIAFWHWKD